MFKSNVAIFGVALLMLTFSTHADQSDLTAAKVRGYIASLNELEQLENQFDIDEGHEIDFDAQQAMTDAWSPMTEAVAQLQRHPRYNEFEPIVKKNGFASAQEWGHTGDRIIHAFMALEMEREAPEMQREMDEAMRELDNNPHMSAEQKDAIRQMMMGAMSSMESMSDAPKADVDAVRPHMGALRDSFEH